VRDSLQYRLKREGYVEGVNVKDKEFVFNNSKRQEVTRRLDCFSISLFIKLYFQELGTIEAD
jgi:hypothetical protein